MQAYNNTDQQIHQLSQILAKFNRSFLPVKDDDSHTNLGFDALGERLLGRTAVMGSPKINLLPALELSDSVFRFYDAPTTPLFEVSFVDKTYGEVEQEIASELAGRFGIDADKFTAPLHFEIPAHPAAQGPFSAWDAAGIESWKRLRGTAAHFSRLIMDNLQAESEIRIWPHHFDTGIYVEPTNRIGLGFGLAMKDDMAGEAYFYLSGYGINGHELDYSTAPGHDIGAGRWITGPNWNGAVLTIYQADDAALSAYIRKALEWYVR
jgi:hypothetical protein